MTSRLVNYALILLIALLALFAVMAAYPGALTGNTALRTRIAPGEALPVSINLANLSSLQARDLTITHYILDGRGAKVHSQSETVRVDRAAHFVARVQLPQNLANGTYAEIANVVYEGQQTPQIFQFGFSVEPKVLGFFRSDLVRYGGIALALLTIALLLAYLHLRRFHVENLPASMSA